MKTKIGIIQFPGSNCDMDCFHVMSRVYQLKTQLIWHRNGFQQTDFDFIILPGGFSYGDYLRTGAIARFAPAMNSLMEFAGVGKPVLGICNGFQILCEANLLPGALVMNRDLLFKCQNTPLAGQNPSSPFLSKIQKTAFSLPIAHGEGSFVIDPQGYEELREKRQIIMTYLDNPNGSYQDIAGITNAKGNVMGMMPHPERASEPVLSSEDGKVVFDSILHALN
jgi:phosphoribosylformylglycinamidine synthase